MFGNLDYIFLLHYFWILTSSFPLEQEAECISAENDSLHLEVAYVYSVNMWIFSLILNFIFLIIISLILVEEDT